MSDPITLPVARLRELPEGASLRVRAGDEDVALWRVDGRVYAVRNSCPHQHAPVLHQATRTGLHITCPMHGWTFALDTGRALSGDGVMHTYPVRIEGERILIEIPPSGW
jgi:nitrite reductase (NADH) small subunit